MWPFDRKSSPPASPTPRRAIQIVERELGSLTLNDWRQDKSLCAQAAGVLSSPIVRQMLQVIHNSHPAFQVMVNGDTASRALQQARCEGYTMALADIESMGINAIAGEAVEAEFGEEEIPAEELAPFKATGKARA
jgi:hypothetical protein